VIGGVQATVLNGRETYDAVRDDVRAANGKAIDNGAFDLTSVIIPTENGLSMLRTDITRGEAQSFINTMLDSPYLLNGVSASDIIRVNGLSPLLGVLDQKATVLSNPWERLPNPSVPQGLPRLPPAVPPDAPRLPPAADPPSIPPGIPRLPPAVPPDAPLLPSAGQTGQSVAASPASPPPGGEPPEPIEGRLIEPFSTWTMATWLTHLGGNGVAQGVQYAHFRLSEETRKDSEPIDTSNIPGEVEEFVQNPQAYLRQNYTGGPLGMSVDGAIYKETLPTNEVQYFQRMPSDLYTAYANELGNPDKIRLPQYVDINGQGEEWVTVEMRPPARDEPWLGGEGVEFIERETNFSAPSGRLAVTVGPPEGIRSRLNGEVTILNPYFSGDATLVEIVPADGAATIRQYNNINLAVIGGSLRMSVGNSDLERVNDNDPTRGPQLSITGGTTARARLSNRLEYNLVSGTPNNTGGMDPTFRPGEARWRSVLQGITTSSTSVVLSDPTGAVTGDVTNAIDNALPGQFQWDQDTPGRQRVFINVGQDLWVNGPDGRFGRIGSFTKDDAGNLILNASGSPDRSISRTSGSLLGNPTGEFNIQIGVQNDDVPNLPDLVQEGATWVANRADPTPATGARATEDTGEELTSFVRRGTLDQATPFQGDLGTVMDGWSQLYGGDALVLSGRRMPTTPEGQVATWHSPEGQEHIRLGWIETLDGNYATVETLIPKTGRGAVPHDTEQGLLLRYAMEQAGMSVGVPLTNDEKISVDRRIRDGAVPPSLVN
jgi:hypothetical protein